MKLLSNYQKEFLLTHFFENEKYAGWKNIAIELLNTGQCIVAGKECIWIGGIGNFIKTEKAKGAIDCILYKFDLEYFFTSKWYKEIRNSYASNLSNKKRQIEKEIEEIDQLLHDISNI